MTECLTPIEFITHALGVPSAVSPNNAEQLARFRLRMIAPPIDDAHFLAPPSTEGSPEAKIIRAATGALIRGGLDDILAGVDVEHSSVVEAKAFVEGDYWMEPTARTLLTALRDFAEVNPFMSIERQ